MPKKRVKTSALWAFALMLMISTVAVAQVGDDTPKRIPYKKFMGEDYRACLRKKKRRL